jgi:hypothetical protein
MSALEQEIIEKFRQLDDTSKRRVLDSLASDLQDTFDYEGWWAEVAAARISTAGHVPAASDLVNEVREERDANLLRSSGRRDSAGDGPD